MDREINFREGSVKKKILSNMMYDSLIALIKNVDVICIIIVFSFHWYHLLMHNKENLVQFLKLQINKWFNVCINKIEHVEVIPWSMANQPYKTLSHELQKYINSTLVFTILLLTNKYITLLFLKTLTAYIDGLHYGIGKINRWRCFDNQKNIAS